MKTSESIKAIAPALLKAQKAIKAALKDATNPHFKSKYADLSSVVDAVKGPLNDAGITFMQGVEDAENGVAVETMLLHESGEWLSSTIKIPASKQDAQGYGSATTYARRYGLQAMCGVPAEDDDGNAASKPKPAKVTHSATDDAFSLLDKHSQETIADAVNNMVALWEEGKEIAAYEVVYGSGFSNDEIIAIYELLQKHSKLRNRIREMRLADNKSTQRKAA